jgi:hypothetical protein
LALFAVVVSPFVSNKEVLQALGGILARPSTEARSRAAGATVASQKRAAAAGNGSALQSGLSAGAGVDAYNASSQGGLNIVS